MRAFEFDSNLDSPRTRELDREVVETEWQLESWLAANPEVILNEPLLIFGRQYALDTGVPDLLALDQWGNVVVVELKKGQSGTGSASEETILSQPQNYASDLSNYGHSDLEDIYREYKAKVRNEWENGESATVKDTLQEAHGAAFGANLDDSEFNTYQRMVILAEEITSRTETNARYLLREGLAVQCVATQRFVTSDERELLATSTVVDYPLSRVQPEDDKTDYSDLLQKIRDRIYPEIRELCHFEEPDDIHRTGTRQLGFNSNHPGHPDPVRYRFKPRIVERGRAVVSLGLWGSDEEEKDHVREVVAEHADALGGFGSTDEYKPTNKLVYQEFEAMDRTPDEEFIDDVAEEMVRMIQHYHPKLVEEA